MTFTASVHRGLFPVGSGTVTFKDGATVLAANVPLNGLGLATFSTSSLSVAKHPIAATFNGTSTEASSADSLNQVVVKADTRVGLVSSKNRSKGTRASRSPRR